MTSALLAALAALAACGGGSTPGGTATATAPPLRKAEATVRARGYFPVDVSVYDPHAPLAAVIGVRKGSADASAQRAFFFADGRFVGNDTSSDSARIGIAFARGTVIGLRYALFDARDPQCCPSGGSATVRYRWDGHRVEPLDRVPPGAYALDGSRR